MTCHECGSMMKTQLEDHWYTESGLKNVLLTNMEVSRCERGHGPTVDIPAIGALHKLIMITLLMKTQRLLPEEIRFLRKHVGWSQADLGNILAVTPETISRWETGKLRMSTMAERFLRCLVASHQQIQRYEEELKNVAVEPRKVSEGPSLTLGHSEKMKWKALSPAA